MKHLLLLLASALAAAVLSQSASAFWIVPGTSGHLRFTREAIAQVSTNLPVNQLGFSEEALNFILMANASTDVPGLIPYSPVHHFDDEQFESGARNIMRLRAMAIRALLRGDRSAAWLALGIATHGIQDFYAHSSWIERRQFANRPRTASHYDRSASDDRARLQRFMAQLGDFRSAGCEADGELLNDSLAITSGYYDHTSRAVPFSLLRDLPYPGVSADPWKCVHLGLTVVVDHCPLPNPLDEIIAGCREAGFEKDAPESSIHEQAGEAARTATAVFIQDIVAELEEMEHISGYLAVCHLFGQPIRFCAIAPPDVSDGAYRLRELCVYSIPSYFQRASVSTSLQRRLLQESDQAQHVCLETSSTFVEQGTLFCRKDGAWIPKSTTWTNPGSAETRHSMSVAEDGTFSGTYVRVAHNTSATSEVIHDFVYYAKANGSTHETDAFLYRKDSYWYEQAGGEIREWYGMGASTQPSARHNIDLILYARLDPNRPLPPYCSR